MNFIQSYDHTSVYHLQKPTFGWSQYKKKKTIHNLIILKIHNSVFIFTFHFSLPCVCLNVIDDKFSYVIFSMFFNYFQ